MERRKLRGLRVGLVVLALGCGGLADDLRRAETAFTDARYEDVEVWTDELAPSVPSMRPATRVRYYYLAGMSAYRMGKRARARHALALCREELEASGAELPPTWKRNLHTALAALSARQE